MKKYNPEIQSSCNGREISPKKDLLFLKNINDQQCAPLAASYPSGRQNSTLVDTITMDNVVAAEDIESFHIDEDLSSLRNSIDEQDTQSTGTFQCEGSNLTHFPISTKPDYNMAEEATNDIADKLVAIGSGEYLSTCSSASLPPTEDIILPPLHCPLCFTHFPKKV